ncbi:MAG: ACT domain-containing protein [Desulfurococcales archaeon]|nr:ACT domain-containing protein [Desulfurococcales archaeon]
MSEERKEEGKISPLQLPALVKVDSKGRVTIPQTVRDALGISPGMYMVLIADIDRREIVLSPVAATTKNIVEINVEMEDKPGALAQVAGKLSELNIDIIVSRCASIARGKAGTCTIIADTTKSGLKADEVKEKLESVPVVRYVKVREFTGPVVSL